MFSLKKREKKNNYFGFPSKCFPIPYGGRLLIPEGSGERLNLYNPKRDRPAKGQKNILKKKLNNVNHLISEQDIYRII